MAYIRECAYCGKEFKASQPNAKYCSKYCRNMYHNNKKIENVLDFKMPDLKDGMVVEFKNKEKAFFYKDELYKFEVLAPTDWFKPDLKIKQSTNLGKCTGDNYDIEKVYKTISQSIEQDSEPLWERKKAVGVCWDKCCNKWKVHFKRNNKQISLGVFESFEEALKEREKAERIYKLFEKDKVENKEGEF